MPDFTSRLGLRKPDMADVVNVAADLGSNFLTLDNSMNLFPCTISSRPANPYPGKLILLTDIGQVQVWTGSAWFDVGIATTGGIAGRLGYTTISADTALQSSGSGETGPHMSITFTANATSRYWVEFCIGTATDGTGGSRVDLRTRLRRANGGSVTTAGTLLGTETKTAAYRGTSGLIFYRGMYEIGPGLTAGNVTVGLFTVVVGSGSARIRATTAENNGHMLIREVALS